jgi:hypothetical protein
MSNSISNWMKKWLDLFNEGTQIRNQEFIPTDSEIDNGVNLTIKYDEWDKQPYMNKEQQGLLDEAYQNYRKTITNEFFENTKELRKWAAVEGPGGYNQEEFIARVTTNPDFAKQWGVTIYTVVEVGNIRIGVNYNNKTIESYE